MSYNLKVTNLDPETTFNVTIIVITTDNEQKGIEELLHVKVGRDNQHTNWTKHQ